MRAKGRLREWAIWRLEGGFVPPSGGTPLGRIQDDKMNAGASAGGFRYDMRELEGESIACMPDGGMFDIYVRHRGNIEHDQRCRDTGALVSQLRRCRRGLWAVVAATFGGAHPRDVVKDARVAARTLGLKPEEYRAQIRAVYDWIEVQLGTRAAA